MKLRICIIFPIILFTACNSEPRGSAGDDLDSVAVEYLLLEPSMAIHNRADVDDYFGPEEIRARAEAARNEHQ